MNGTNNAMDKDNTYSGEPVLTSPQIYLLEYKYFIDCGTYIIDNDDERQQYGRLLSTSRANNYAQINGYQPFETVIRSHSAELFVKNTKH